MEYKYCSSCGGALSERIEYESDDSTVKSWLRYQYHGLNLLWIDEKWDSDNDADIDANDLWRVMNLYVHGPGQIGQTVRSTAYTYSNDDTEVQCQTRDYYYFHDALGNVNGVMEDGNYYRFETDAFGNDLPGGNEFLPMDSEGLKEHQTGKIFDTTTGLYYFHARWYDAEVGRFVGRDPILDGIAKDMSNISWGEPQFWNPYSYVANNPLTFLDPTGMILWYDTPYLDVIAEVVGVAAVGVVCPPCGVAAGVVYGITALCQTKWCEECFASTAKGWALQET